MAFPIGEPMAKRFPFGEPLEPRSDLDSLEGPTSSAAPKFPDGVAFPIGVPMAKRFPIGEPMAKRFPFGEPMAKRRLGHGDSVSPLASVCLSPSTAVASSMPPVFLESVQRKVALYY